MCTRWPTGTCLSHPLSHDHSPVPDFGISLVPWCMPPFFCFLLDFSVFSCFFHLRRSRIASKTCTPVRWPLQVQQQLLSCRPELLSGCAARRGTCLTLFFLEWSVKPTRHHWARVSWHNIMIIMIIMLYSLRRLYIHTCMKSILGFPSCCCTFGLTRSNIDWRRSIESAQHQKTSHRRAQITPIFCHCLIEALHGVKLLYHLQGICYDLLIFYDVVRKDHERSWKISSHIPNFGCERLCESCFRAWNPWPAQNFHLRSLFNISST